MIEVRVTVRNDEQSLTQKHLLHQEGLVLSKEDATLSAFVQQAIGDFKDEPDDVIVKTKFVW